MVRKYKIIKKLDFSISREDLNIKTVKLGRYSTGNNITKKKIVDAYLVCNLVKKNEKIDVNINKDVPKGKPSLKEIDERLITIDDYI